jgi:hypothetical protein
VSGADTGCGTAMASISERSSDWRLAEPARWFRGAWRRRNIASWRSAEERDELSPFQVIELHWNPPTRAAFSGYRIGRDKSVGVRYSTTRPLLGQGPQSPHVPCAFASSLWPAANNG